MCSLKVLREKTPGAGGPKDILGFKFWPKGLSWVSERLQDFFELQIINREFLDIVTFISSN